MIKTILVIIPYRGIGDLLFHMPLLKGIYNKYQKKIIILTNKANKAKNVYLICLLGFSFYAALIGFVAYISQ